MTASSAFWPADLVQTLAQRRGIVFLGAGASATCVSSGGLRQPDWLTLLNELSVFLEPDDNVAFEAALAKSRLLDAAQIVVDSVEAPALHAKLLELFNNSSIKPSRLYDYVNLIDQPIVMTTNYDRMFERFWENELHASLKGDKPPLMVSHYQDSDVVDNLRSDRRLLLKLHGTVEKPRDIVLSRSQYSKAKYEYANYYKIVSALMLTRTVLFLGCGFSGDPDIDLLLEDAAFAAQSTSPHYALVAGGRHVSEVRSLRTAFNIRLLEYPNASGDHAEMLVRLEELAALVNGSRY